jgi:hypothetical protein
MALVVLGCEHAPVDPGFANPRATVMTLLRAHHLDQMPTDEIRQRMARTEGERFGAVDEPLVERCFEDFDPNDPVDHGLAGFLVGVLAARRDELTTRTQGDRAVVSAGPAGRIVLHHRDDGWKISLEESVPRSYRERMESIYERARKGAGR